MTRNPWTPEQIALIRKLAGRKIPKVIAQRISSIGPEHSLASLYRWCSRRRLSIRPDRKSRRRLPDRRRHEWSEPEDALLRSLAGHMWYAEIADTLNSRFFTSRQGGSIRKRARVLGLSLQRCDGLGMKDLLDIFPISITRVWAMVDAGTLRAERRGRGVRGSDWLFLPADIEAWLRAHPYLFDWRQIASGRWRDLARTLALKDPYLTVRETATFVRVRPALIQKWIRQGHIDGVVAVSAAKCSLLKIPFRSLDQVERLAAATRARAERRAA